jgi:ferrous-iron efflux pump FieF
METADVLTLTNDRLRRQATYASITVASILIIAKLVAYLVTDSVSVLSSLLDSTIDLLSSVVTAYGVAKALRPPDHDHRFGHGKAEPLAALTQAAFIIGSSVLLAYTALSRLYHPHDVQGELLGYAVMILAIVLTMALITFQRYVIRRTQSMAIGADHAHYIGDVAINFAVIAAFALHEWTGITWSDPAFALAIAGGLALTATRIVRNALHVLMDRELPDADREKIKAIVLSFQDVDMHDLRTRSDSDRIFINFHLEMNADLTLRAAQKVDDAIVNALKNQFPHADISVHVDPAGLMEERLDEKIQTQDLRG